MLREFIDQVIEYAYSEGYIAVYDGREDKDDLRIANVLNNIAQWEEYKAIENLVEPKNHVGARTKEHIKGIIELMTESNETECEPTLAFSHADIALVTDALANYIGEKNE